MALSTRARMTCPDDKLDKTCDYIDNDLALDLSLEAVESLEGTSNGTSNSSIVEMNNTMNNTNGKKLQVDTTITNDHRQLPTKQMTVTPSIMKKIKQIYMEEVPMHLSGLSLSGSGMDIYVKIDDKLERALKNVNEPLKKKSVGLKKRRNTTKTKTNKNVIHVKRNTPQKEIQQLFGDQVEYRDRNIQLVKERKTNEVQRSGRDEPIADQMINQRIVDAVTSDSKQAAPEYIHHFKIPSRTQHPTPYSLYGCDQNFQRPSQHMVTTTTIKGPSWNVENGRIDVIKPQDAVPSTSNTQDFNDMSLEFTSRHGNPFPGGFSSQNLPLKRRMSPQGWRNRYPLPEDERAAYENGLMKKRNSKDMNHQKSYLQPTTSQVKCIPQQTSSEVSMAQSSVGPTFQTDLLKPHTMDADTLIKFTEYTHAIRKDLKQKYKDLSKLVKSFEESVQEKNNAVLKEEEEANQSHGKQSGQCRLM